MYTFYFKVCPAGLSAKVKYKLIALKGWHNPIEPELGKRYGREALSGLVANGHRVIIQPARPSSAPHPDFCKGLGDTAVPTMRYAKGYGPAPAKSSDTVGYAQKLLGDKVAYSDFSNWHAYPERQVLTPKDETRPTDIRNEPFVVHKTELTHDEAERLYPGYAQKLAELRLDTATQTAVEHTRSDGETVAVAEAKLVHKVELAPEIAALMKDTKKSLQKMAKDPAFVKSLADAGYKINWENWDSVSAVAAEKVCQYLGDQEVENGIPAVIGQYHDYYHWTPPEDTAHLTRWERIKAWFHRNFTP